MPGRLPSPATAGGCLRPLANGTDRQQSPRGTLGRTLGKPSSNIRVKCSVLPSPKMAAFWPGAEPTRPSACGRQLLTGDWAAGYSVDAARTSNTGPSFSEYWQRQPAEDEPDSQ